jgi:Response regulator containing CheY-like receiver domain and AraC-type DNA-binding domain
MAVAYLIFGCANFMEFIGKHTAKEADEALLFCLATLIVATSQAFLFTYSLILLINTSYVTPRRIVKELIPIIAFSVTAAVGMFILPEMFVKIFVYVFTLFYIRQLVQYTRLFVTLYRRRRRELENFYSGPEPKRLEWIIVSFFTALGVGISALAVSLFPHIHIYVSLLCQCIYISVYIYFAIRFFNYAFIFRDIEQTFIKNKNDSEIKDRVLPISTALHLEQKIGQWIGDKGFLKNNLTLNDLARQLGTNNKYLSIYINKEKHMTFRDWINSLRIQEAKTLLLENTDLSIKDISFDVGFSSHAYFGKLFLENTGFTPQTWRARNQAKMTTLSLFFLLSSTTIYFL